MTESLDLRNRCRASSTDGDFDENIVVYRYADTPSDALINMFETRKRIFVDELGWDLPIKGSALEVDQFDHADASYVVTTNNGETSLTARMLPVEHSMVKALWPEFMDDVPEDSVEVSRMCAHGGKADLRFNRAVTREIMNKVKPVFAIADDKILRVYALLGIKPVYTMKHPTLDGIFLAVWT